jgi:hypothetical protein
MFVCNQRCDKWQLSNTLYLVRHPLLIGAPAGVHPIRASVKKGLNPADIAVFYTMTVIGKGIIALAVILLHS